MPFFHLFYTYLLTYYITSYVPGDTIDLRNTWQTIINICSDFTKYANYVGFPRWLSGKEFTCQARDPGSIPGSGRSSKEGNGNPLQYSCLGNPMDRTTAVGANYEWFRWGCRQLKYHVIHAVGGEVRVLREREMPNRLNDGGQEPYRKFLRETDV